MVQYTFYYFPVRGRGEPIRHLLLLSGKKYEEKVISMEEWPSFKPDMPLGQLPVLEVDGTKIGQSVSILRFLGHQFHRAGKNAVECARLDMIAEVVQEMTEEEGNKIYPRILLGFPGYENVDKTQHFNEKIVPIIEKVAPVVEKFLMENGGNGLFIGDSETWLDLYAAEIFSRYIDFGRKDALDAYPNILQLINRIHSIPVIKKRIETRGQLPG